MSYPSPKAPFPTLTPYAISLPPLLTPRSVRKLTPGAVTWTNSKSPQNLCGDSSFVTSEDGKGPSVADCKTFLDYVKDRQGFWLVTAFGSPDSWKEFARVESCVIAVRHTNSATGTIP